MKCFSGICIFSIMLITSEAIKKPPSKSPMLPLRHVYNANNSIWGKLKNSFSFHRPIKSVSVLGAIELPKQVILKSLVSSGLTSSFTAQNSHKFEDLINRWYRTNGFVVSHVVHPINRPTRNGQLTISVVEPKLANHPVKLSFFKANLTKPGMVPSQGSTKPSTVSFALGLEKGKPMKWSQDKFDYLQRSNLFKSIKLKDVVPDKQANVIHLTMDVVEQDSYVYFEPGITGSFSDRSIRGMLKLKHENFLGLGYKLGCDMSYINKQPEGMLSFENDRFGRIGGFQISGYQRLKMKHQLDTSTRNKPPLFRRLRGFKGKVRVLSQNFKLGPMANSIVQSLGVKAEATEGADDRQSPHVLSCLQSTTNVRLNHQRYPHLNTMVRFEGNTGVSGVASQDLAERLSEMKQFCTSRISSQRRICVDSDVDIALQGSLVKQTNTVPRHERYSPRVRGCDTISHVVDETRNDAVKVKEWKDGSIELHRPVGRLNGLLFFDAALLGEEELLTSCGAGIFIGPFKVEVARHRARNHISFGLR